MPSTTTDRPLQRSLGLSARTIGMLRVRGINTVSQLQAIWNDPTRRPKHMAASAVDEVDQLMLALDDGARAAEADVQGETEIIEDPAPDAEPVAAPTPTPVSPGPQPAPPAPVGLIPFKNIGGHTLFTPTPKAKAEEPAVPPSDPDVEAAALEDIRQDAKQAAPPAKRKRKTKPVPEAQSPVGGRESATSGAEKPSVAPAAAPPSDPGHTFAGVTEADVIAMAQRMDEDTKKNPPTVGAPLKPDDDEEPAPADGPAANATLLERLQWVREQRAYIKKRDVRGPPYKSAVAHADLLRHVRPLMVKAGIIWYPSQCQIVSHQIIEREAQGDKPPTFYIWNEYLWTYVFAATGRSGPGSLVIQVSSTGLSGPESGWDKAGGKASTYADKYALLRVLALESGDDPDLTPVNLSPDMPPEIEARIAEIRKLLEQDKNVADVEAKMREIAAAWGKKYSRRVANIYGLPAAALDETLEALRKSAGNGKS